MVVDHGITLGHLKGTLEYFLKALIHEKIKLRFRPSFFPFTEPSAEVDIECTVCEGKKKYCRVCSGSGWIEILGAGMIDPQVFKISGTSVYSTHELADILWPMNPGSITTVFLFL